MSEYSDYSSVASTICDVASTVWDDDLLNYEEVLHKMTCFVEGCQKVFPWGYRQCIDDTYHVYCPNHFQTGQLPRCKKCFEGEHVHTLNSTEMERIAKYLATLIERNVIDTDGNRMH
uniref:Uncharacterized protein n=1 Tax=Cacopsylla melanoneura TaxID=428564 RepID=A0A8D8Z242_9HEMI